MGSTYRFLSLYDMAAAEDELLNQGWGHHEYEVDWRDRTLTLGDDVSDERQEQVADLLDEHWAHPI